MTAAIVERELLGGECSYWACMPSKALLRPIAVADVTGDLEGVSTAHVAPKALLERRDYWVSHYDDSGPGSPGPRVPGSRSSAAPGGWSASARCGRSVVVRRRRGGRTRGAPSSSRPAASRSSPRCTPTPSRGAPATPPAWSRCPTGWSSSAAASSPARRRSGCPRSARTSRLWCATSGCSGAPSPSPARPCWPASATAGITVHLGAEVSDVRRADPAATGHRQGPRRRGHPRHHVGRRARGRRAAAVHRPRARASTTSGSTRSGSRPTT